MISTFNKVAMGNRSLVALLLIIVLVDPGVSGFLRNPTCGTSPQHADAKKVLLYAERQPWNFFRFVEQSSRFVNPFTNARSTTKRDIKKGDVVWKAGDPNNDFTFAPLDDVVMGGASASRFDAATGKWTGDVTDANSGGFIGIRSTPFVDYDMSTCQGVKLQITAPKGSSLRLKVVVRDSTDFNGVGWTSSVDINPNKVGSTKVQIPFSKQVPTRFAQTVSGQYFAKNQVRGIQLVFSKFEYDGALNPTFRVGDFQVQVAEIRAY